MSGNTILSASVNVPASFLSSYGADIPSQTHLSYLREIGHALGLGDAGNYDGDPIYGVDNHYTNDSWQASVMSPFSQTDNTTIDASFAYPVTPMSADILAIQDLYGAPDSSNPGFTMYGTNPGGYPASYLVEIPSDAAYTIYDSNGDDLLNFIGDDHDITADQRIDLRPEGISDVAGGTGNLIIARGTIIERAYGSLGNDTLIGNDADNTLVSYEGDDTLLGGVGDDRLNGWDGRDLMSGGPGDDTIMAESDDVFLDRRRNSDGYRRRGPGLARHE
ncbi:M10 family metallopeptidase C-terminal domain-containing protein [Roseibium salinum]|nr:M10 family metallopeptidase C-terminal domain-containing protein [Roseibium salinum]